jgi:hypothetical protein
MKSDEQTHLKAIAANPEEDVLRLEYHGLMPREC